MLDQIGQFTTFAHGAASSSTSLASSGEKSEMMEYVRNELLKQNYPETLVVDREPAWIKSILQTLDPEGKVRFVSYEFISHWFTVVIDSSVEFPKSWWNLLGSDLVQESGIDGLKHCGVNGRSLLSTNAEVTKVALDKLEPSDKGTEAMLGTISRS